MEQFLAAVELLCDTLQRDFEFGAGALDALLEVQDKARRAREEWHDLRSHRHDVSVDDSGFGSTTRTV